VRSMATNEARLREQSVWIAAEDLWLEVFIIFNFVCLAGDVTLAHAENHFRNAAEYIPLWFSMAAAATLIVSMVFRTRNIWPSVSRDLGYLVGWLSIVVGAAGVFYHLNSSFFYDRTLKSLTYAAPFAAPLAYMGLGCLLVMNRMVSRHSKEWAQWVLFFALGGFGGNFALSLSDHAINGFFRWSEWIPVVSSGLAVGFLLTLLIVDEQRDFLWQTGGVLFLQILVGGLGFILHAWADWHRPAGSFFANVISGAPPFAPLLFPNLALLGFIGILAMDHSLRK
jgi:hypothetical protein